MNAAATEKSMFVPRSVFFLILGLAKIVEGGVGLPLDSLDGECQFRRVGQAERNPPSPLLISGGLHFIPPTLPLQGEERLFSSPS